MHDGNVREFIAGADKDREVIVYCYHRNSSFGAVADFLENGFKNVAGMSGGFEAWRQVYKHEAQAKNQNLRFNPKHLANVR